MSEIPLDLIFPSMLDEEDVALLRSQDAMPENWNYMIVVSNVIMEGLTPDQFAILEEMLPNERVWYHAVFRDRLCAIGVSIVNVDNGVKVEA